MQKISFILLLVCFYTYYSCDKPTVEKPGDLISEEKMIALLTDIHLAEATFMNRHHQDSLLRNSSSANFYYSVLKKHEVADSVFERSYVFYLSRPKKFEKMYRMVMNNLNEMEQEFSGRERELIDLDLKE
jgi:hypothetical protein